MSTISASSSSSGIGYTISLVKGNIQEACQEESNWLSVHQLSVYHTVILAFKVIQARSPKYLYTMFNTTYYNYKTRQADSGKIKSTRAPELDLAKDSFSWRAAILYNELPDSIRNQHTIEGFKLATKLWIVQNIELS